MLDGMSLLIGVCLGFALGVMASKRMDDPARQAKRQTIRDVLDNLDVGESVHFECYVGKEKDDGGDDDDGDVKAPDPSGVGLFRGLN